MRQLLWAIFQLFIGYVTILAMDGMVMPASQQIAVVVGSAFGASLVLALIMRGIAALVRRPQMTRRREPALDF